MEWWLRAVALGELVMAVQSGSPRAPSGGRRRSSLASSLVALRCGPRCVRFAGNVPGQVLIPLRCSAGGRSLTSSGTALRPGDYPPPFGVARETVIQSALVSGEGVVIGFARWSQR